MSVAPRDPHEPITAAMWTEIHARYPNVERLEVAWRLALDVETLDRLLAGEPVNPDRIDQGGLAWARERSFVQLTRPIDVLIEDTAA